MKKGISIWAFADNDLKKNLKLAKEMGFDGVELALEETGLVSPEVTKEQAAEIVAYAKEIGIELYSIATGLYWTYSVTSNDEQMRNKAIQVIKDHIRVASYYGCETILVVPGAVKVDFAPHLGVVDYDVAYDRALAAIKEIAPVAEEYKVHVGLENVWNQFLLSPLEMRDFIDKVGSPYIGSYFDVGNVVYSGCPEHWIKILNNRIKKVHFKDFQKMFNTVDSFCDLLVGDVDYDAVMQALENVGYDGWVTAEVFALPKANETRLKHTSIAMDYILKR